MRAMSLIAYREIDNMLAIVFLSFHLIFALVIFFLTIAFVTGAPFVPSVSNTAKSMIRLAKLRATDVVYDLGSGDGRLIFVAGKVARKAVGVEINPFLVMLSEIRRWFFSDKDKVKFKLGNFWRTDLSEADVVFVYLLPWKMQKLENKLKDELKNGTKIVSNSFIFANLKMVDKDEGNHVYVFEA